MAGDLDFTVNANVNGAINQLNKLQSSLGAVTSGFKVLLGAVGVTSIVKFGDSVTDLKNKLNTLTASQEQTQASFKAIAAIAVSARSDLGATGDLFFRIARAADQLGISQQEAASITESVAKALTASGMSAQEAAGPLLQLGQALQSGTFQGDELRSILEGLPAVSRALADSLGVPVGALKTLGSQGKITGEVFVEAMRKAKGAIDNDFARTIPTVTQALNVLKTNLALAFNAFETQTQTGQSFAQVIEYIGFQIYKLSKNIDSIIGPLMTFIKVVGTIAAFTVVGRVLSAVGGTIMAVIRGVGMLGTNIGLVVERIMSFGTTLRAAGGGLLGFAETVIFTLLPVGRLAKALLTIGAAVGTWLGLDKLGEWFKSLSNPTSEAADEMAGYRAELLKLKKDLDATKGKGSPKFIDPEALQKARNEIEKVVIGYQRQNSELTKRLKLEGSLVGMSEQQKAVKQSLSDLESNYLQTVNQLMDDYRVKSMSSKEEDKAALPEIQKAIVAVTDAYKEQIGVVEDLTNQNFQLAELEKQRLALAEFSIKSQIDSNNSLRRIQDDIAKSTMTEIEQKYYDIARASEDSARAAIESENSRRRSLGIAKMTAAEEKKYYDAAIQGNAKLAEATKRQYEESRKWSTGWKRAFNEYVDNATNAAKQAEKIFTKFTSGIEDLLVNFVKTGKFEWKQFVADMLETLLRGQIQQAMSNIFSMSGMGSGSGGFLDTLGSLLGFGSGGAEKGSSQSNPLFVYAVNGGGLGNAVSGSNLIGSLTGSNPLGSALSNALGINNNPLISGGGIGGGSSMIGNVIGGITSTVGNIAGGIWDAVSDIGSSIGDFFGGFFANGGTLGAGKWGIAGENGPELISGPANITPMGGGQSVTYNINAVDAQSFKAMIAADPSFIHAVAMQGARGIPSRR